MNFTFGLFSNTQPQNDIDWGREAVKFFHNEMLAKYPSYSLTMDELLNLISKNSTGTPQPDIFLDGLGGAISSIPMKEAQVSDAMVKLADAGGGQVPANNNAFFKALSNRIENITAGDWIGAAPEIAEDTAATVLSGAQAIGNAVIDTGKTLTMIGPAVAVAVILFIVYSRARQLGGR